MSASDLPAALSALSVSRVAAGHVLFREGARAPLVFLVKGAVRIERGAVVLDLVRAPAFVVDVGFLDGAMSASSAVTLRASSAILCEAMDPSLRPYVERATWESLRARARLVDSLTKGDAEARLLAVLSNLADCYGATVGAGRFIGMPIRRNDLARMVGVTLETASRILARLERAGSIRSRRDGIWLARRPV